MRQRKYFRTNIRNNLDIDSYVRCLTQQDWFKGYVNLLTKTFVFTSVETYVSETYKCKFKKLMKKNDKAFFFFN